MKAKFKFTKKLLSVFLCLALLFSYLPSLSVNVFAAEGSNSYYNRVVDANTMDGWKEYFPLTSTQNDPLSTENAGGVWTDKSVFSNADAFPQSVTMVDDSKNFLTALSAVAANKEVVGYSTVPTDTVFILDLSNSMSGNDVTDLVDATNDAIKSLQQINNNNRVGVVLYSGTTASRTYSNAVASLMPIDRYTSTHANGDFIEYEGGTVRLAQNWRGSLYVSGTKGTIQSEEKDHGGATYIQAGLWEAYKMFNAVPDNDIYIGTNNWQAEKYRMPIVVLMSDGAPTLGTNMFDDVENSYYGNNAGNKTKANVGNGNDSNITAGQGFLVQLTASYIKNRIENKYKVDTEKGAGRSLFYTLGFNISADNDDYIEAGDIAYSVLNPRASTITDSLWATYNRLTALNNSMEVRVKGRDGDHTDVNVTKNSYATSKLYVDEYFSASGDGLSSAFDDIVAEIILQSRYYPTHLEGGSPDFSGYIDFTDTLGEYMEVKHVNGILYDGVLFDGHMMASKLADTTANGLGTPEAPTPLGDEFINSIRARLGISDVADARSLVAAAYRAEQLCYKTDNAGNVTKWSNYIGWFADAAGNYIGHWDETSTQSVPANAVYKIKSYGFLGKTQGSIKNSDMMYMTVQVKTDIVSGLQTVSWKIPASLVPMITYLIELDGTNVNMATNVRISVENGGTTPIRLIYETGLRSDLNEFNITRITDAKHLDGHNRVFWNNYFANLQADSHDRHITAMSEFVPNKENERFYYTFPSAVYKAVGNDYQLVTENEGLNPDSGTYYHRRFIFSADSTVPVFFYEKMSAESVRAAVTNGFKDDFENLRNEKVGAWVVPAGTPARELQMYDKQKEQNPTKSARMVFHPYMSTHNDLVAVDMNLGNNGLLTVTPATGIRISKTVDIFEQGTSDTFKFRITASESGTFNSWITHLDATPAGQGTPITLKGGVYEFEMKKDQTFWLSGLSANTRYTVEEISDNDDYKIKSVKVNNVNFGTVASGTVAQYMVDDVRFVNTAVGEGDLIITKQVTDANGNIVDVSDDITFTAQVTLTNAQGQPVSGTFGASNDEGELTVPANGVFTVSLKEGGSFILRKIPEETRYTVTEINVPAGFTFNANAGKLSGVVDASANDQAVIVNVYEPVKTNGNGINVEVTKTISGNRTNWIGGESYTFTLERDAATVATDTISASDNEKKITFSLAKEQYEAAGTYLYTIKEQVGTQGGITYDTAQRRFSVTVEDADKDGDLEIVSVKNEANTVVTSSDQGYTVSANFNNIYAPTGTATVTIGVNKKMNGDYRLNGFQFALYNREDIENADEVVRSTVTDASGKASFTLSYAANGASLQGTKHTYFMAEINTGNPNITYDNKVYKVTVTVKDNGDGTVSADYDVEGLVAPETTPSFTNTFTPSSSAYVTLTAKKTIEGDRVLNANEFDFVIEALTNGAPMPANGTASNTANGDVVFGAIKFDAQGTYKYKIYESDANKIGGFTYDKRFYEVTVEVRDNGQAQLLATVSRVVKENANDAGRTLSANEFISFNNLYDAKDATVTLTGSKILTGKTLQNDEFAFALAPVTAGAPMPASNEAKNNTNGIFTFDEITYTKAGTYIYTLSEVKTSDDRYDFDKSVYTVIVTVTDNSVGTLSAKATLEKNGLDSNEIVFRNGFKPTPKKYDITAKFGGQKVLEGRPLAQDEFEFKLINAINGEQIGETVKNDANGAFAFPQVTLPEAGTYHYKITEVVGDAKSVSYDTTSYHVLLVVEQLDSGELNIVREELHKGTVIKKEVGGVLTEVTEYTNITGSENITFRNNYKSAPVPVVLEATKTLTGRDLIEGEFKFDLHKTGADFGYNADTLLQDDIVLTLNANGTGNVRFMPIVFDAEGIYHYVIVEDEIKEKGVTPDTAVYEVEIKVEDNHQGNLVATLKVNGNDVTASTADVILFNNLYEIAATEIIIKGTKTLKGRDLKAEEFDFELYDNNGKRLETVKNGADGSFAFTAIPVEEAGRYVYTVKEMAGSVENVTYDTSVYTVTAEVSDNLDGTFKVSYSYAKGNEGAQGLTFLNIYTLPTPPYNPEVPKTGDNSELVLWFALLFVSGGALTSISIYNRKRKAGRQ